MASQADGRGHLRHVLAADQLGADAGQLALLPFRMRQKQRLGHHQTQNGIAQKLQALIVARLGGFFHAAGEDLPVENLLAGHPLIRQRPVGQCAHQQLRAVKTSPQRGLQFGKNSFHMRLD